MATVVVLILLAMVLGFVCANLAALAHLHGELKVIERKQLRRLNHSAIASASASTGLTSTNSITIVQQSSKE
jgi:hypothetical protein